MGVSNELSCETGSFSHALNPQRCFQSGALRLNFPVLEPWVVPSISLPSLSARKCGTTQSAVCHLTESASHHLACPIPPALPRVLSAQLPISAPPTSLDECFFFNSLVVGLPYILIFCQFWLFFVFKFVVVLLLVVREGIVCLPMPPSWPDTSNNLNLRKFVKNITRGLDIYLNRIMRHYEAVIPLTKVVIEYYNHKYINT